MSLHSDEVNFLVYRYLLESGFEHTAFLFGHESFITKSSINGALVPTGALISVIQKGLQYVEAETHIQEDGTVVDCQEPFSLVKPHKCKVRGDPLPLYSANERKRNGSIDQGYGGTKAKRSRKDSEFESSTPRIASDLLFPPSSLSDLSGHSSQVLISAWSPDGKSLAAGAADGTVRIWNIHSGIKTETDMETFDHITLSPPASTVLTNGDSAHRRHVTSVAWSPDGQNIIFSLLDGQVLLWSAQGKMLRAMSSSAGGIMYTSYSPDGKYIGAACMQGKAVVWDASTGTVAYTLTGHSSRVMDLSWRDDTVLATAGADGLIMIADVSRQQVLGTLKAHKGEVNCIEWDSKGKLLASCSDDGTIKLWDGESLQATTTLNLDAKVHIVKWCPPQEPGKDNPYIAAASGSGRNSPGLVQIFDMETKQCVQELTKHKKPVYALDFSKDGEYLATGSIDHMVFVWSTTNGALQRGHMGQTAVFSLAWSGTANELAVSYADAKVSVIDVASALAPPSSS
eukprot:Clim_evm47s172 gene=Clim_evmTU47s172